MQSLSNQNQSNKHFQDLMLHRVHDILLVASPYDAFILEEDGRLTEQILHEYLGMNLSYAPRVWQANTASYAMDLLSRRSVDLIIVMMNLHSFQRHKYREVLQLHIQKLLQSHLLLNSHLFEFQFSSLASLLDLKHLYEIQHLCNRL